MEIEKPAALDILVQPDAPALSSTSDVPLVETKPDATPAAPTTEEVTEVEEQPGESATPATETEQTGEPAVKKESRGVQKALDRITAERETERRRADQLHEQNMRLLELLEQRTKPQTPPVATAEDGGPARPIRENYPDPYAWDTALMEYSEARADWTANQILEKREKERKAQAELEAIEQGKRMTYESYMQRVGKVKEKYPDFDKVAVRDDVIVSEAMADSIRQHPRGPEIQYYFGSNPGEASRIMSLSPAAQSVEMGLILAKLDAPTPLKPVSAAPRPIKPIAAGTEPAVKDPEEMSMEEYADYRRAQGLSRGMRH